MDAPAEVLEQLRVSREKELQLRVAIEDIVMLWETGWTQKKLDALISAAKAKLK